MKELTIEEKAKRYDKAFKEAENIHKFSSDPAEIKRMEQIFPELKESEDERIRKEIIEQINLLKSTTLSDLKVNQFNSWIAWLEKQGSEPNWYHHKVDLPNCSEEYRKAYYDGWNNCSMQYSQCKSEGNDVVKCLINGMKFYYEDNEEATWGTEKFSMKVKDILSWLEKQGKDNIGISKATKQKLEDNLNKALEKETPESWNKFLEKQGEQKPIYSEEQHEKESLSNIENRIINFAMQFHDNRMKPEAEWEDELKMLRDNIKIDSWSEEDEVKINRIVACLENLNVADNDILLKDADWLKSLKQRIGG